MNFHLNPNERNELWELLIIAAELYQSRVGSLPVAPALNPEEIRSFITDFASGKPDSLPEILRHVIEGMTKYTVHTANPGYFGLFNPKANFGPRSPITTRPKQIYKCLLTNLRP